MKLKYFIFLIIVAIFLHCSNTSKKAKNEAGKKEEELKKGKFENKLTDDIIFKMEPQKIFEKYDYKILFPMIKKLRKNVIMNKDAKSFKRIIELYLNSDGVYSEELSNSLNSIFINKQEYFLKNIYQVQDNAQIYREIIYHNFKKLSKKKLKKYGKYSETLIKMYNYYLENPDDLF